LDARRRIVLVDAIKPLPSSPRPERRPFVVGANFGHKRRSPHEQKNFFGFAHLLILGLALPSQALAQNISLDLGQGPTPTARLMQITLLITVLSLAPSILIKVTCFTRVCRGASFMRQAIGVQQRLRISFLFPWPCS
jgi:hypothetical protein